MKRATVTVAAGLLFTAAALKLAFPVQTAEWIDSVKGKKTEAAPSLETVLVTEEIRPGPVTVTINAAEALGEAETVPTVELPAEVEAAMETFLEQQEPFDDLAVPANVSYDAQLPAFPFVRPVTARTSSAFGYRVHPLENLTKFHYGTDLAAMSGDDVVSFAGGVVTEVGRDDTMGNYVRIEHEDGYATLYAHCGSVYVSEGQRVAMGEKIALVGATGKATGPHLHFELSKDGVYLNPEIVMAAL